jgi:hypothetical protein
MEILAKILQCVIASSSFYLIGILIINPSFLIIKYLEKKGFDYEYILEQGHKVVLIVWAIAFVVTTYLYFK